MHKTPRLSRPSVLLAVHLTMKSQTRYFRTWKNIPKMLATGVAVCENCWWQWTGGKRSLKTLFLFVVLWCLGYSADQVYVSTSLCTYEKTWETRRRKVPPKDWERKKETGREKERVRYRERNREKGREKERRREREWVSEWLNGLAR